MCFGDCSDSIWATCFQEHGEVLLSTKCEVLGTFHQEDHDQFDGIIKQSVFKSYTAKFRAKMETYNVSLLNIYKFLRPNSENLSFFSLRFVE